MLYKLRWLSAFAVFAVLMVMSVTVLAQDDDETCPVIVGQALEAVDEICDATGRNEACYGNSQLVASAWDDVDTFEFEQSGDITSVSNIQSLSLSELDATEETWGVALMVLQANLPDTLPGQNVTMLAFGDTEITNAINPADFASPVTETDDEEEIELIEFDGTIVASGNINVRSIPSTNGGIVGSLGAGTEVTVDGRNEADDWYRVQLPDGGTGWVFGTLIDVDGETQDLLVTDAAGGAAPAQSIVLREEVSGSISANTPTVTYAYEGTADELLSIRMERTGGDLDTFVYIQAPNGDFIASNDDDSELGTAGSTIENVRLPEDGTYNIVASRFGIENGSSSGDYTLVVDYGSGAYVNPMQAFYIRAGIGAPTCADVPQDGVLIQTPDGVSEVRLLVNEVQFDLGSTAFIQAEPNGDMIIYMLEGTGRAESFGVARIIPAGAFVTVPVDGDLAATDIPSEPQPYDLDDLVALPVQALPDPIDIADPVDEDDLISGEVVINLTWDNDADMDVWLIEPDGTTINFANPGSISGARLDVDANPACRQTPANQENITWPSGQPRLGTHTVQVNEWSLCNEGAANWTLTVTIGGEVVLQEEGSGFAEFEFER